MKYTIGTDSYFEAVSLLALANALAEHDEIGGAVDAMAGVTAAYRPYLGDSGDQDRDETLYPEFDLIDLEVLERNIKIIIGNLNRLRALIARYHERENP